METATTVRELRELLEPVRAAKRSIALVPTMGNLHQGHLSLVDLAARQADFVLASVFVNPTQFGPDEDYASYPRTPDEDAGRLQSHGCDALFSPTTEEMYPEGVARGVQFIFPGLEDILCAAHRSGHFDGVARVVSKLFNLVLPQFAVFGEKDYQQLLVVRRLVAQLSFPVEIVAGPIVRDQDGMALSSRNRYLTPAQRRCALALPQGLAKLPQWYREDAAGACQKLTAYLSGSGLEVDYAEVRQAEDLGAVTAATRKLVGLAAARIGNTRLIDNIVFAKNIV